MEAVWIAIVSSECVQLHVSWKWYLLNTVLQSTLSKVDKFGTLRVHLRVMSSLQMVIKNIASTVRETGYESWQNIEVENNGAVRSCWKLPACACTILFLFTNNDWINYSLFIDSIFSSKSTQRMGVVVGEEKILLCFSFLCSALVVACSLHSRACWCFWKERKEK